MVQRVKNATSSHEDMGSIPGLDRWVKDPALLWALVWVTDSAWILHRCGCGIGWVAAAPIWPLAWEHPYTVGMALKRHTHTHIHKDYLLCITHGRPQDLNLPMPQSPPLVGVLAPFSPRFPDEETEDQRISVVCLRSHSWLTAQTSCYFLFSRCSIFLDVKDQQIFFFWKPGKRWRRSIIELPTFCFNKSRH